MKRRFKIPHIGLRYYQLGSWVLVGQPGHNLDGRRGTRLGTLTETMANPMPKVGGRPCVEYAISQLARFDIRKTILPAGYQGEVPRQCYDGCHFLRRRHRRWERRVRDAIVEARTLGRKTLLSRWKSDGSSDATLLR